MRTRSSSFPRSEMFSFFRRGATAKIMLAFLGLALFAMVITGFGTGGGGLGDVGVGGGTIARAGDEEVTINDAAQQVNRQLEQVRQQQPELDIGNFLSGGTLE